MYFFRQSSFFFKRKKQILVKKRQNDVKKISPQVKSLLVIRSFEAWRLFPIVNTKNGSASATEDVVVIHNVFEVIVSA